MMKYILSVISYSTVTVTVTTPSIFFQAIAFCIHLLTTKEDDMQSKLFHPKKTASHTGLNEANLVRKRWSTFTSSPFTAISLRRPTFLFFKNYAHCGHCCTDSFFQGEKIINTHLYSFAWFLKDLTCVVVVTTQVKSFRDGAMSQYLFQEEK